MPNWILSRLPRRHPKLPSALDHGDELTSESRTSWFCRGYAVALASLLFASRAATQDVAITRVTVIPATGAAPIQKGRIADLVLLDANPLSDIRNTTRVAAVVSGGTVYDRTGIDRILADVLRAEDLRLNDWRR